MKKSVTINFNLSNRAVYTLVTFLIIIIVGVGVYAFGTSNPSVFGHSVGEIEETDPTVLESVKDGVSWNEINFTGTTGFEDGTDAYNPGHGDGSNCPTGQYSKGVDANGNSQGCVKDGFCTVSSTSCSYPSCVAAAISITCPTTATQISQCDNNCVVSNI